MDDSLSISLSLSKGTAAEEMSLSIASLGEAAQRIQDSISNEKICRGDVILETYEVTSDAITGGMGSVWKVYHRDWDTDLAMKRPKPRFFAEGSERRKEEFIRECENWINLGLHPHIVSCYYVRELGGVPAIFSEWMDRGSLKNCIRDGSLYEGGEDEYLDLDLTGTCLLYGVDVRRHARGDESLAGIFQKNLVTGEIIRMGDFIYNLDAYQGYGYQKDGTILVRKGAQLTRKRKEDGKLLKTYRLGNAPEHRIIVRFNNERDKAFVTCDIDKFRSNWFGFRMDGTIFFKEKNTKFSRLATCFGGRFIALSKSEEFQIRDIEKNEVVYSEETRSNHDISMRPDGREFFTRLDWKLPVHAYRLEYEYELPEEGRISAPATILRMLNDEEEEGIVTEVRVEDWDREPEIDADKVSTIENDAASKGGTNQAAETSETEKTQKKEGFFVRLFRRNR